MKTAAFAFLSLLFVAQLAVAETVLCTDTEPGVVAIPLGQVALFDFPFSFSGGSYKAIYDDGVSTCSVEIISGAMIPGPCTVTFPTEGGNNVVSFRLLSLPTVTAVALGNGEEYNLTVPTEKTVKILTLRAFLHGRISITRGSKTVVSGSLGSITEGLFLTGPLEVTLHGTQSEQVSLGHEFKVLFSFYIADDAFELSDGGIINSPAGSSEVLLEKSYDLTSWTPLIVHSSRTDETKAFFRVRIVK